MRRKNSGFTLAELLIVVAIIAVLVAIAIPIFSSQLECSRESVDLANVRSAYGAVMTAAISGDSDGRQADGTYQAVVSPLEQKVDGWTTDITDLSIGGVKSADWIGSPKAGGSCTISVDPVTGAATINWNGGGNSSGGGGEGGESGGEGGEGGNGSTTPEEAAEANQAVIDSVSSIVNNLVNNTPGTANSTKATVEVTVNGDATITVSNSHNTLSDQDIINALRNAGVLSADGKVNFDPNDTRYPNGYRITVNHNNGNHQVQVEAL